MSYKFVSLKIFAPVAMLILIVVASLALATGAMAMPQERHRAPAPGNTFRIPFNIASVKPTETPSHNATQTPARTRSPTSTQISTRPPSPTSVPIAHGQSIGANNASKVRPLASLGQNIFAVAWSPDGKALAIGGAGIWLYSATDLKAAPRQITDYAGLVTGLAFSSDAKALASISWLPVSMGLSVGSNRSETLVCLWSLVGAGNYPANPNLVRILGDGTDNPESMAFSPDGKALAMGEREGTVRLWDVVSDTLIQTFSGHTGSVGSLAFSRDGKLLASGSSDKTIQVWDTASGALLQTFRESMSTVYSLMFSPDGKTLAAGSTDKMIRLWDVSGVGRQTAKGKLLHVLSGHTASGISVAFSPDGKTLASGGMPIEESDAEDGAVRLWDVTTGSLLQTLSGHVGGVFTVTFSPDGSMLASTGGDFTGSYLAVIVWGVTSRSQNL